VFKSLSFMDAEKKKRQFHNFVTALPKPVAKVPVVMKQAVIAKTHGGPRQVLMSYLMM
jgi:hypothetical protein